MWSTATLSPTTASAPIKIAWNTGTSAPGLWLVPPEDRGFYRAVAGDPAYVEGVKARYSVRAALDPAWADPLSALRILNPSPETWEDVAGMTRAHRIEVAVAALRAHALHRPAPARYVPTFGGTVQHIEVREHTFTVRP